MVPPPTTANGPTKSPSFDQVSPIPYEPSYSFAVPMSVPLETSVSLPFFNYAQLHQPKSTRSLDEFKNHGVHEPGNDILRQINAVLTADLADVSNDLSQTRNKLYTEMTKIARFQHQVSRNVKHIRTLKGQFQRFLNLLVDIGIPYFTVQRISDALDSGPGIADHMLVSAIGDAIHDPEALLSNLKPAVVGQPAPERYHPALHRSPAVRRKARAQEVSKFRRHVAPHDGHHAETDATSSSNISVCKPLSPACQPATDTLNAYRVDADSATHVCGGISVQDGPTLASPASGFEPEAASPCSTVQPVSDFQCGVYRPSPSNECIPVPGLRASRRRAVLGDIDLNVLQRLVGHLEAVPKPGNSQQDDHEAHSARPPVALTQDLIEDLIHVAFGRGYRHSSSSESRSSTSSRLSSFDSPFSVMHTSTCDLIPDKSFDSSTFHNLLYGTDDVQADSDVHEAFNLCTSTSERSTRSDAIYNPLDLVGLANSTRSLSLLDPMGHAEISSESFDLSEESNDSLFMSPLTPTTGPTTPSKTPNTAKTTPSYSGSMSSVSRHLRGRHEFVGVVRKSDKITRRLSLSPESFIRRLQNLDREGSTP